MATAQTYTPFTFEHFMQAVHSLRDELYMYYIDEAVAIYCRLRGISVGPRPASSKNYSRGYADAFEAANYAIFLVSQKIGSYDSGKGPFRPYLDRALENALKDILKADGHGDFFDQTSKKKFNEDEPERHLRVEADRFWGQAESDSEPDSVSSDRDERIRKHKDEALETMIKFIDSLPEIKRAAIYASAFGQALRPDLESYGRNYADILADKYGTTALYIRKMAAEGKRAALEKASQAGFNENSMAEVSMGYIQARTPVEDLNDKVLEAISQLDAYQQFQFLQHLAGIVGETKSNQFNDNSNMSVWGKILDRGAGDATRKENEISTKEQLVEALKREITETGKMAQPKIFPGRLVNILKSVANSYVYDELITIEDKSSLLHKDVILLLKACMLLPFKLGKFTSIDDILTTLHVKVIIDPSKPKRAIPTQLMKAKSRYGEWKGLSEELDAWQSMKLRGLYNPDEKVIMLFPNNMKDEYDGQKMKELLVSTLAHEAMHAYFERPGHDLLPYVIQTEEPMAEFGMLLYLYDNDTYQKHIFNWARNDVRAKRTCYRYGDALMSLHLATADANGDSLTRRDLERYKYPVF